VVAILIEDVRVAERALDVPMVHRLLNQFEIFAVPQEFGAEVVAEVVEAEIVHAGVSAHALPR
jgi:hypothetical protein